MKIYYEYLNLVMSIVKNVDPAITWKKCFLFCSKIFSTNIVSLNLVRTIACHSVKLNHYCFLV